MSAHAEQAEGVDDDSPRRTSHARERILATADRLFYDEGIHAVGIQRIISESRVTRVTLYRHFASKDELVAAYLERRAQFDQEQVGTIIATYPDDPRRALSEIASVLTRDDFAALKRGCPFINASAEFAGTHSARAQGTQIRRWHTDRLEELLTAVGHRSPRAAAAQLMMVRTGAVVSGALDHSPHLNEDFITCWNTLIDDGITAERRG
ncbi:MAG: helix-turn-helix domain-containing protein [Brevundimonas sp.]